MCISSGDHYYAVVVCIMEDEVVGYVPTGSSTTNSLHYTSDVATFWLLHNVYTQMI